jgi:hypothetical protein
VHRGVLCFPGSNKYRRCKQLETAERDARHASELRSQIGELQTAIKQISQQIIIRQAVASDEEQTKLLDDMKDMQLTSVHLQRRATERLEFLTSLTGNTDHWASGAGTEVSALEAEPNARALDSASTRKSGFVTPVVGGTHKPKSRALRIGDPIPSAATSSLMSFSPAQDSSPGVVVNESQQLSKVESESLFVEQVAISAQQFENELSALLLSASSDQMGISKPFSDDLIMQIATMLSAVGKLTWSERPRTYLVLRLINEVKAMDIFVLEGFKDIDFPYTESTLPSCVNVAGARHDFLHQQRYVLSPKSVDLVRGGRHRHLG